MLLRHKMSFEQYSDAAVRTMLRTAAGKPFKDSEGEVIGSIKEVKRSKDNRKVLEFVIEIEGDDFEVPHNVVSMSMGRKKNDR